MSLILGIFDSTGAAASASSYESIASFTTTGGETSFSLNSIPSTYQHIQIRGISRRNAAGGFNPGLRFNSDSGSNYTYHRLVGDGSTATALGDTAQNFARAPASASSTHATGIFGVVIFDIHDYASTTKNKTIRTFGGFDANGSGQVALFSNLWQNTAAINSVTFFAEGDAFAAGSTFALYGIKG